MVSSVLKKKKLQMRAQHDRGFKLFSLSSDSVRRHGRVVKATDLKSVSFYERRFESYCLRPVELD